MGFFFLASISGLFPGLTLPIGLGWKEIHAFDLAFAACIAFAAAKGALRSPDWRLIGAGATFLGTAALALWAHPSPEGDRAVISLAYSVVVVLAVSHLRIDALGIRVDRTILWPLFAAIGIAAVVFLFENLLGVNMGRNESPMLPFGLHRLGGLTGGNTLILFIALAAPFVRSPRLVLGGILLPAFATFSRSILGVGVALLLSCRGPFAAHGPARRLVRMMAWLSVVASLYAFAVIPIAASERATNRPSFEPGGYLTPHLAAIRMIGSSPLVGLGPARFPGLFGEFTSRKERERLPPRNRQVCDPHSALLGLAAELGLLGLAGFGWLLYEIYRRLDLAKNPQFRLAAIAGVTGLLAGGHFVDWLALKGLWFWIGLLVAAGSEGARPFDGSPTE